MLELKKKRKELSMLLRRLVT